MLIKTLASQSWLENRIQNSQIRKYLNGGEDFIDESSIVESLAANRNPDSRKIQDILKKALAVQTLTLDETAALLNVTDSDLWFKMQQAAGLVKKKVYDHRIVTFAPLYTGNICVNNCLYCGFRRDNLSIKRRILDLDEIKQETTVLTGKIGHKRLIVVYGEHPASSIDYLAASIRTIYSVEAKTRRGTSRIRRVNVNAAPLSIEDLRVLGSTGIGTYQVFQETYHKPTYRQVHPQGTLKADYRWRLYSMHRAIEAGIDDVGIGALFGLYDWRFEVLGLLLHARELEDKFGIGPHTISFPRLEPALNVPFKAAGRWPVSDSDFQKLITVIRLAVPYTGLILTARENAAIRKQVIPLGCTQTDASARIGIGAYSDSGSRQEGERQQFFLGDTRSLDTVVRELAEMGFITSFCTAGYRCGRTGKCIMDLLRSGEEGWFCKLNAILTFREWLDDFATASTRKAGEKIIRKELAEVKKIRPAIYPRLKDYYRRIKKGERDLYF